MEDEGNLLTPLLLMQSAGALSLQLLGIGSAYSLFVSAVPLFVALSLDAFLNHGGVLVNLWTYALGMFVPLLASTKMACSDGWAGPESPSLARPGPGKPKPSQA